MQTSKRFAGLTVPFLGMMVSASFGIATMGLTVFCAAIFLAGVAVNCTDDLVDRLKDPGGSSQPPA